MTTQRTRIKFCGVTRAEDALAAAALGVDAVGFVLTRKSRRFAGIERARQMRRALPPFVTAVALFMDDDVSFVSEAVAAVAPDLLQFHGSEAAPDCVRYGRPYLKAVAMRDGLVDWRRLVDSHAQATGFLFDGHAAGEQGGSGRSFDWSLLPRDAGKPVVLAGGLTPENVAAAIRAVRPWAVDVSSGIEAEPGLKDIDRMRRFIAAVRTADEVG
ncbi:MAG TPA: phosphoribosylanthranilate isomerase [Rudaea sp.]|nr:phosphoribosylanthranilate isomerase [Rudaea sp.]